MNILIDYCCVERQMQSAMYYLMLANLLIKLTYIYTYMKTFHQKILVYVYVHIDDQNIIF